MSWCTPEYARDDTELWVKQLPGQWKARENFVYLIENGEGKILGTCGLSQVNWMHRFANLGYWIRSSETRKGYASAACRLLADWGFEKLGLNRIEILMAERNKASRGVANSLNANFEGVMRSRIMVNGRVLDARMYSLIPADFEQSKHAS
jgi:RimJ/RimL family protein N-acetyltransferase